MITAALRSTLATGVVTGGAVAMMWMLVNAPLRVRLSQLDSKNTALRAELAGSENPDDSASANADAGARGVVERMLKKSNPTPDAVEGRLGLLAVADACAVRVSRLDSEEIRQHWSIGPVQLKETAYRVEGETTFGGAVELLDRIGEQTPMALVERLSLTPTGSTDSANLRMTLTIRIGALNRTTAAAVGPAQRDDTE